MSDLLHGTVIATVIIAEPDTPKAYLVVTIEVDCPECGKKTLYIPGHHLKAIREIATRYCDEFPALTAGTVTLVDSQDSGVMPPAKGTV